MKPPNSPRANKIAAVLLIALLDGCSSQPISKNAPSERAYSPTRQAPPERGRTATPDLRPLAEPGNYRASSVSGDYAGYPALGRFIDDISQKHGFHREYLYGLFSQAKRKQWTLDYLAKSDQAMKGKPAKGGWSRYRAQFLDARHIDAGVAFWQKYRSSLQRASREYGVPAEYILGILAVETTFGGFVGNHRVIDALTTLAFDYQRRGEYFRGELENFLVMTRAEGVDPGKPVGSFAGAMGLGQFMPSSFLQWAVDFNGDGRRDLWNPEDAIGSVAHYFAEHGWQAGQPVVSAASGQPAADLETGFDSRYSLDKLTDAGLKPAESCSCDYPLSLLLLRHHDRDEYRLGHPNFYVITRYNHSTHYAMAVHELAQAIKSGYLRTAGGDGLG
ncbi:lytic murein transglycosylase B [Methylomonas sp. MED-D]|uniref:lytic murein transglycosylase B n=1 Tax=unclassified Methylomonas TaxID=2608980 RepID=UPI0028A47A91|nr:lytic murein transglycosylase B [Methylomonas sp. MV1]MDT4330635.1 lytic murein transglycosylase B [Methylomonas sp. MV1]